MERLTGNVKQFAAYVGSLSRPTRMVAAFLLLLAVAGAVWLGLAHDSPSGFVAISGRPVPSERQADLRRQLDREGIPHRLENGHILVPRRALAAAQGLMTREAPSDNAAKALEDLAGQDDLWLTRAQSDKRWLVAKMTSLGRLIATLPPVRSATVILAEAAPSRLSRRAAPASAAVKIALEPSETMTYELTCAIADIVAGSVAGMKRQDVRIIDGGGKTYRACEDPAAIAAMSRTRRSEDHYARQIRTALGFIPGAIVTVQTAESDSSTPAERVCRSAHISIPRSYLAAAYGLGSSSGAAGEPEGMAEFTESQLAGIRRRAMRVAGILDARAVVVEWHYDVASSARDDVEAIVWQEASTDVATPLTMAGIALVVLLAGALYIRRRFAADGHSGQSSGLARIAVSSAADGQAVEPQADSADGPFAFLREVPGAQLLGVLGQEHPQTIALVLAHLGPGKAAAILAGLEPERQVEVIRRVAALQEPDSEVAREIAAGLRERLGQAPPQEEKNGGVSTVAQILSHAGYASEKAVLEGLSGDASDLADSIRRHMFEFEDIVSLPPNVIAEALASMDGDEIAVALRASGENITDKVLESLPSDRAAGVRREMEQIGPVRLSDVEAAQQRVAEAVRRLASGQYVSESACERRKLLA